MPSRKRRTPQEAIKQFSDLATACGMTLLSSEWQGASASYQFRCPAGHLFERGYNAASKGKLRCETCRYEEILARFHAALERQGFVCESDYRTSESRLRFRCPQGHTWEAVASSIYKKGTGCPRCAEIENGKSLRMLDGLEQLSRMAASHGGVCLANAYTTVKARYPFRCAQGHEWLGTAVLVLRGHWCRQCRNQAHMLTVEQMQELALARGGRCLSAVYLGCRVDLMWECAKGHVWQTKPATILYNDRWCPNCALLARTKNRRKRKRYDVDG